MRLSAMGLLASPKSASRSPATGLGATPRRPTPPALDEVTLRPRVTRAGTPRPPPRAGTSRVTTAPAATNASSPTSTPGHRTTPPPTRQARRRRAPRSAYSGPWRPIVSSFVVQAPGPTKTSSSSSENRGQVDVGLHADARADDDVVVDADPRPMTLPAPIRARSRTNDWSPRIAPSPMSAPANTIARAQTTAPARSTSGGGASRRADEWRASFGGLPRIAPSWISQPSPITVPGMDDDVGAEAHALADPHAVAEQQSRGAVRRLHAAPGARRRAALCSAASTRTTRSPERRRTPACGRSRTQVDEVLALRAAAARGSARSGSRCRPSG